MSLRRAHFPFKESTAMTDQLWMRRLISLRRTLVSVWILLRLCLCFFSVILTLLMARSLLLHIYRAISLESLRRNGKAVGLKVFISNSQFYKARQVTYIKQQTI